MIVKTFLLLMLVQQHPDGHTDEKIIHNFPSLAACEAVLKDTDPKYRPRLQCVELRYDTKADVASPNKDSKTPLSKAKPCRIERGYPTGKPCYTT